MNNLFSQNDAIGRKSYTSTQYMSDSKTQSATDPHLARISPLLRCPACAGEFAMDDTGYRCRNCDEHYPLHEGVPMLARITDKAEPSRPLGLVLVLEVGGAWFARDSLSLTIISFIHPVPAIEAWQDEINPWTHPDLREEAE